MSKDEGRTVEMFQVDAFTSERFKGNPAGVCIPEERLPDNICQAIAAEMNLSETAFIHPVDRKEDDIPRFGLRWFTPATEVDLCGHATLATAKVLFQEIGVDFEVVAFDTRSGPIFAHREGTAIRIDLPASPSRPSPPPPGLIEALGIGEPRNVEHCGELTPKSLVELEDEAAVRAVDPDHRALGDIVARPEVKGVIVTARGSDTVDFVSRYFAPWVGIDEDPVTGAAHTVLGPYWASRLGKDRMRARQVSARGGELMVKVEGDRVHLTGEAVVVLDGTFRLD